MNKETYADRFLRQNGIKKDKDGTPDIIGKVMGDYQNSIRKAHEINKKMTEIKGTLPASTILTNLKESIKTGEVLVKVVTNQKGYKETQLIDKITGYIIIPEHIVPVKPIIRPYCVKCKGLIDFQQEYNTKQIKGSNIIKFYHKKCRLLEGTTSTDGNWDGTIKDNE